jgi:hypothetical protein
MPETEKPGEARPASANDDDRADARRDILSVSDLRHPWEGSRFLLALVPSVATLVVVPVCFYAAGGVKAVAVFVGAVVAVVVSVWVLIQIHRARLLGGAIRVSSASLPEVQAVVDDVCRRLDYRGRFDVWILEKVDGQVTLTSYLGTKMILVEGGLASDLVTDDRRAQLTFLIARFVGALKAKHLRLTPLQVVIASIKSLKFVNIFIHPYERAIVYSGDQIGLACAGGLGAGLGVINRLLVGKEIAPEVGAEGVLVQAEEARRGVLPRVAQLTSSHPNLTNRYLNLLRFGRHFDRRDYEATIEAIDPEVHAKLLSTKRMSRGRLAPWLVGVPSVAIAGVVVAAAVSGARPSDPTIVSTPSPTAPTVSTQPNRTPDPVSQSVAALTQIVNQSSIGRQAAIAGEWQVAIANRQQTLEQLKGLKLAPQLTPFRQLLPAALSYSLLADRALAACGGASDCPQGDYYDSLATASKRQFLGPFNRAMRAYGVHQYSDTEF